MVRFLSRFSMKNPAVLILLILTIIGGGIYSYAQLKMEQYPNVDIPYLTIGIIYPGATPEQSMNDIGIPLEKSLANLKGLKNLYDSAATGYDAITLEMDFSRPIDDVIKEVQGLISSSNLPSGAQPPTFKKQSPDVPYIYSFALSSSSANSDQIQQVIQNTVKPALQTVANVDQIMVNGIADKSIYVKIDPAKLKQYNLTLDQVKQTLIANNLAAPVGNMTTGGQTMAVQAGQSYQSLDDIRNVNLIIVKQDMSKLNNAFSGIQQGFDQVGSGLQSLGKAQALMQGEIQLIGAMQGLSGQLLAEQSKLAQLQAQNKAQPGSVPSETLQQTSQAVVQEQNQLAGMQQKLASLQTQLAQMNGGSSSSAAGGSNAASMAPSASPALSIQTLKVKDIGDVVVQANDNDINQTIARINGAPAVVVQVKPQPGSNVVQIVQDVKAKLAGIDAIKADQIVELRDESVMVKESVNGMVREAGYGALFAVIITLLFLRNFRATWVAVIAMPLSILSAVILLNYIGYTLNIMTLSGIAVAVGRVVDDSIVVIENIFRRIRGAKVRDGELVQEATQEVGSAIVSSTITTVSVFLPMTMVSGIVGRFFAPFAWTVVIALLFSLLVAITVVPLVARWSLLNMKQGEEREGVLQSGYRRLLSWSLRRKWVVVLVGLALLIESGYAFRQLGFNFIPNAEQKYYDINIDMPVSASIEAINSEAKQVEAVVAENANEVAWYQTSVSQKGATVSFAIKDDVKDTAAFENKLRTSLSATPGAKQISLTGTGSVAGSNQFFVSVNGPDSNSIAKASDDMVQALKTIPGLADVQSSRQEAEPRIQIQVDNDKAASHGVNPAVVMGTVRDLLSGETISKVSLGGQSTDLNLQLAVGKLQNTSDLGDQMIPSVTGDQIPLRDIATISVQNGPTRIQHLNQQEYISITGEITDANAGQVTSLAAAKLGSLPLPKGVTWNQAGAAQSMNEGFMNLAIAMIVSVLLVFVVMLVTFGEMTAPLAILFSLPFAIVGGFNGLWLTHEPLGMPGMIGFLMLIGIIVTNAIVLMDRVEQQKRNGLTTREALLEAGSVRLRPILMTATATIAALIPLALSTGAGIISKTLAIVVIGGLTTSTLLTLVVVPIVYDLLLGARKLIIKR